MQERDEEGRTNDGPENRKRLSAQLKHERLRETQLRRNPRPHQGPDQSQGDGRHEAAWAPADERPADGAADGRDEQKNEESL